MKEVLKLALEALEYYDKPLKEYSAKTARDKDFKAIASIKEALAQPEQEPVAHSVVEPLRHDEYQRRVSVKWVNQPVAGPLYTTPPQRKPWVSLSDEDIERIAKKARSKDHAITLAMRELKEKNT